MKLCFALLFIFISVLVSGCTGVPEGITPVKGFDIARYDGRWYEIARLDHSFERGMQNVTATYEIKPDGSVAVLNQGFVTEEGVWKKALGKAKFVDSEDIAHLKVSFFGPFYGSYIVFDLDKENYQYAYITSYNKEYLWLLSRTPEVSEQRLSHFRNRIRELGFEESSLIYVSHDAIK